jgi:type I restriction enzyme S subunit
VRNRRLKYVVSINRESLTEDTDPDYEFRYVDIGAVGRGVLVTEPEVVTFGQAPSRARRIVRDGDTIVSTVRTYLRAVWPVTHLSDTVTVSTGFAVLTPGSVMDPRYLGWLAQSDVVVESVVSRSVGVSYPAINASEIGDIPVPLPPMEGQRAIADYLDAETARIDALIEKKRQLIELLEERRMAVMTDGISGKLTGPMLIGSDLPWIETRGSAWRVARLSLVSSLGTGHTPSREHPEWWTDCTIPWITTGEVAQMRSDRIEFITETREMISEKGIAHSSAVLHPAGTVVLCRTASAGYSAIMGLDMATSQDFATWTCGPLLRPRFLLLCLRVMRQDLLGRLAMGSTHQTIYMPDIEALRIPLPNLAEQDAIVERVWGSLRSVDRLIDAVQRQVELLVEHRQALITGAVTGDLEIPGVAA